MAAEGKYNGYSTFQEFLDNVQYSTTGILSYEKIFGYTYVSTGGESTTSELCDSLPLKADSKVLDVGCGIGGSAFYLVRKYGCSVEGIDLSKNMISIGQERLAEAKMQDKVELKIDDCTTVEYPADAFDLVYSRDTILHIEDKLSLFRNFYRWTKPGGQLLITDYCAAPKPWPADYEAYVKKRGYFVIPVAEYGQLLQQAGFVNVQAIDYTDRFLQVLNEEVTRVQSLKEEVVKDVGEEAFQYILDGWKAKIDRVTRGAQKWGLFKAEKP